MKPDGKSASWIDWLARGVRARNGPAPAMPLRATIRPPASTYEPIWRQMLNAMTDAAMMLDARGSIVTINAAAGALFQVKLGHDVSHLRVPLLLDAVHVALQSQVTQACELHVASPVERHLSGTATPLRASAPSDPALLIVLRDRTEIERLAQMRADFVANASHELRTPLASLKGFIETLQGAAKDDPEAREKFLGIMQEQADRMSRLIEDLLSLSRIEMREHLAPTAIADVRAIVDEIEKGMQPLAETNGRHLTVRRLEKPVCVMGDRDELAQVVQNLVHNAIKYGRPQGTVAVSVRRDGQRVLISVTDDGIGIAPQHLPRLTERFYRVSAKESRERGGTGLGLAIVKHIVNRHRGELRIESELGKGSTFTVVLPAAGQSRA